MRDRRPRDGTLLARGRLGREVVSIRGHSCDTTRPRRWARDRRDRPEAPGDRRRSRGGARCWTPVATCRPPARPRTRDPPLPLPVRTPEVRDRTALRQPSPHVAEPITSTRKYWRANQVGVRSGGERLRRRVPGERVPALAVQQGAPQARARMGGLTPSGRVPALLVPSAHGRTMRLPAEGSDRARTSPITSRLSGLGVRETAW